MSIRNSIPQNSSVSRVRNALSIDLEDYYHVSAFQAELPPGLWGSQESRIEQNTERLLADLRESGTKATFFVLGWVAQNHPEVVRQISQQGHEIACHSLNHRTVYTLTPEQFRSDTLQAKRLLEDVCSCEVKGYRAPSFSVTQNCLWALTVLAELGFTFDSSIFPVRHANYGIPGASRLPYRIDTPSGPIIEFPMTTLEFWGHRSPFAGGAYFRLLPYWYTRWGIHYLNSREGQPVCVYLHPWELDPDQPAMNGTFTARVRHYLGLKGTQNKFRKLIRDFEFSTLGALTAELYDETVRLI